MRQLVVDMDAGRVQTLLIIGEANPVFSAPADWKFGEAMKKVALRAHSGLFYDETAEQCQWHVPSTHYLEMWSDARSIDGTVSIVQPLLQPMYGGKSPHEVIATLSDRAERSGYDVVREFWSSSAAARPGAAAGQMAAGAGASSQMAAGASPSGGQGSTPGGGPTTAAAASANGRPAAAAMAAPSATAGSAIAGATAPTAASAFEKQWRRWLHDGYLPDSGVAPKPVALAGGLDRRSAGGHVGRRLRSGVQARRLGLRRPLRQQRLAAGIAQAGHQADLGQRRRSSRRPLPSVSA